MNTLELAKKLDMHPDTVRRLCRAGKLPSKKKGRWVIEFEIDSENSLSVQRLSSLLRLSTDSIYKMIHKTKSLKAEKIGGRYYILKTEVQKIFDIRF